MWSARDRSFKIPTTASFTSRFVDKTVMRRTEGMRSQEGIMMDCMHYQRELLR